MNFANLFNKPVIFLTSSNLDSSFLGHQIKVMASWFGKSPIYFDTDIEINWERELTVSAKRYEHYRQAYIKTKNSEDLPFWQIVANRLKRM